MKGFSRFWLRLLVLLLPLFLVGGGALAKSFETVSVQGFGAGPVSSKPWEFPDAPGRLVIIGDIHGDFEALVHLLIHARLIDGEGKWIGGNAQLVLMGDLINRGDQSFESIQLVRRISAQAKASDGKVHSLFGNHEMFLLDRQYEQLSRQDILNFGAYQAGAFDLENVSRAFTHATSLGRWFLSRNTVVKIGKRVFVHAGLLPEVMERVDMGELNATVRAWAAHLAEPDQFLEPPRGTKWVLGEDGPLFTRKLDPDLKKKNLKFTSAEFFQYLQGIGSGGATEMYVGHYPLQGMPLTSHPVLGSALKYTDTSISDKKDGRLAYFEVMQPGGISLIRETSRTVLRPEIAQKIAQKLELLKSVNLGLQNPELPKKVLTKWKKRQRAKSRL